MAVKHTIKKIAVKILPGFIKRAIVFPFKQELKKREELDQYINLSFSQEGEDLVLYRLLGHKAKGFYVDIGAHHPYRFSNTYKFYQLGWHGINIDPLPGSMELFKEKRPSDINIEAAIVNTDAANLYYYMFDEPALNTMDEKVAKHREETVPTDKIINTIPVPSFRLKDVLDRYLPTETKIDFFTIDVEGMDFSVIQSNDWNKYRPAFIVLESLNSKLEDDMNSEISLFLTRQHYHLIAKTANSLFYKNVKAPQV